MATHGSPSNPSLSAKGLRFAVCAARWNASLVEQLIEAAVGTLNERGGTVASVFRCAGVFELPALCARVARKGGIDGIVAVGCLIRGETDHYALLAAEVTRALGGLAIEAATSPRPVAVSFGVLACDTLEQAQRRAAIDGLNKGGEAALACVEQVRALREVGD
jgi:6,7-dimethyl-8-ribityllumazine synthase